MSERDRHVGTWLHAQRRNRGWTTSEMVRHLIDAAGELRDVLPAETSLLTYIGRWERGTCGVSRPYRLLYCRAFDIDLAEFGGYRQR
jgi:hypothetical protein